MKTQLKHWEVLLSLLLKSLFITPSLVPAPIRWFLRCLETSVKRYYQDDNEESDIAKLLCNIIYSNWLAGPLFNTPSWYFNISAIVRDEETNKGSKISKQPIEMTINNIMNKFGRIVTHVFRFISEEQRSGDCLSVFNKFVKSHQK